jgi:hypothetical protein
MLLVLIFGPSKVRKFAIKTQEKIATATCAVAIFS